MLQSVNLKLNHTSLASELPAQQLKGIMSTALFVVETMVRGYHVYQENWSATVGEELVCQRETGNICDAFAVSVIRASEVVGHIPSIW